MAAALDFSQATAYPHLAIGTWLLPIVHRASPEQLLTMYGSIPIENLAFYIRKWVWKQPWTNPNLLTVDGCGLLPSGAIESQLDIPADTPRQLHTIPLLLQRMG